MTNYSINCTGDVVVGDTIKFIEAVFGGSFRKPKYRGDRTVYAKVLRDSYGADKQQHTFSIEIIKCCGVDLLPAGTKTTRKGRNIYRNGTWRKTWSDESQRDAALDEKHCRGNNARAARDDRRHKKRSGINCDCGLPEYLCSCA